MNAFMHTGSYEVPTRTITGSIRDDMVYVDKVMGVKVALADHRCSFPATEVLAQMVSDIRIGGMVAGKKGVLHIHMGELPDIDLGLSDIFSLLSTNVADSVGLAKGRIAVGCDADFTAFSAFSPSALSQHKAVVSHVIARGQILMSEGE